MESESLVLWVPSRCGLKAPDIGSMAQFSLSIATDELVVGCLFIEDFALRV